MKSYTIDYNSKVMGYTSYQVFIWIAEYRAYCRLQHRNLTRHDLLLYLVKKAARVRLMSGMYPVQFMWSVFHIFDSDCANAVDVVLSRMEFDNIGLVCTHDSIRTASIDKFESNIETYKSIDLEKVIFFDECGNFTLMHRRTFTCMVRELNTLMSYLLDHIDSWKMDAVVEYNDNNATLLYSVLKHANSNTQRLRQVSDSIKLSINSRLQMGCEQGDFDNRLPEEVCDSIHYIEDAEISHTLQTLQNRKTDKLDKIIFNLDTFDFEPVAMFRRLLYGSIF